MEHPLGMPEVYSDPDIHGGQPVLESGIPIYLVLDMLAQGFTRTEMRRNYGITAEHIRVALRFASDYLKSEGSRASSMEVSA
ncbi:MAG TPA: DUF433 domain-containing protein [Ktedonobacterales bacterium]